MEVFVVIAAIVIGIPALIASKMLAHIPGEDLVFGGDEQVKFWSAAITWDDERSSKGVGADKFITKWVQFGVTGTLYITNKRFVFCKVYPPTVKLKHQMYRENQMSSGPWNMIMKSQAKCVFWEVLLTDDYKASLDDDDFIVGLNGIDRKIRILNRLGSFKKILRAL